MRILLGVWLALVCVSVAQAQTATADFVLLDGKVVTVDPRFDITEAVAVRGDRIIAVGTTADIRGLAAPGARVIDLQGRTVIPGLIDVDTHAARAAQTWQRQARLDGILSRDDALEKIRTHGRKAKPGEWVLVIGGWAEDQFRDDRRGFTRDELDRLVPDHPVYLQVNDSHAYANTLALAAAGIDAHTPDPKGGKIERDARGRPTGRLDGAPAFLQVFRKIPPLPPEQEIASATALLTDLSRVGITAICDVGGLDVPPDFYKPFDALDRANALTVRIYNTISGGAPTPDHAAASLAQIRKLRPFRGDDLRDTVGFSEMTGGTPRELGADTTAPPSAVELTQLRRVATALAQAGLHAQIALSTHAQLSAFLGAIEDIDRTVRTLRPLRWTIAYVDELTTDDLARLRRLGMMVAVNNWPTVGYADLNLAQGDRIFHEPPLRLIRDSGVRWGVGTDATVMAPINPFYSLYWLVTGKSLSGQIVTKDPVSREDALIAWTQSNAYFVFRESDLGSIQPGKLADLVVLDRDYMTVPPDAIRDIKPAMTIVGGKIVYTAR